MGLFELQIRQVQNSQGLLQNGECCDLPSTGGQRCSFSDQCDTFFHACLKEYQTRVAPTGPCTFGSGRTDVLGRNSFSLRHHGHGVGGAGSGGGAGAGGGGDGSSGSIVIRFKFAWPVSAGFLLWLATVLQSIKQSGCWDLPNLQSHPAGSFPFRPCPTHKPHPYQRDFGNASQWLMPSAVCCVGCVVLGWVIGPQLLLISLLIKCSSCLIDLSGHRQACL